jgi:nuclear RNA export factor
VHITKEKKFTRGGKSNIHIPVEILSARYNVENKFLNLANFMSEPHMVRTRRSSWPPPPHGYTVTYEKISPAALLTLCLRPSSPQATSHLPGGMANVAIVNAVCEIIAKNCADVITIDLSQNDMATLDAWRRLSKDAPALANLSLENNALGVRPPVFQ